MPHKQLLFRSEARAKLLRGAAALEVGLDREEVGAADRVQ
jgi:hypothetical protein